MNWNHAQLILLAISPCLGAEIHQTMLSRQPRILLPLDLEKVPPAKVLLDELQYYLSNDRDDNYHSNTRAIKHHLDVLKENYPDEARNFINQMSIWSHSEHFLERLPRFFLDYLVEIKWKVHPEALGVALNKLDTLLPQGPMDMIDCAAGKPMGQIITLLAQQKAAGLLEIATKYAHSQDQDLSYAANCALLSLANLPEPTVKKLVQNYWGIHQAKDLNRLSREKQDMAILITVNEGAMKGEFESWVDVNIIIRAMNYLHQLQLTSYAQALQCFIVQNQQTQVNEFITGDDLHMASIEYSCLAQPSPRNIIAEQLLKLYPYPPNNATSTLND